MAFVPFADRVKETSTTTGTGTLNLAGAETGFQTFVAGIGSTNSCFYCITDDTDWEIGVGTVTDATPDTLSRDTILASSNSGAAVNWGAGTKTVFCTFAAAAMLATENLPLSGGVSVTKKQLSTATTGTKTLDLGDRPIQYYTNNGAHTLAPGSVEGASIIQITNGASAGAITTSGWTMVTGDAFTTTNGDDFMCDCRIVNGFSHLHVTALQ